MTDRVPSINSLLAAFCIFIFGAQSAIAGKAAVYSPREDHSSPIHVGIQELNRVLTNLGWSVTVQYGEVPKTPAASELEILTATFDKKWLDNSEFDVLRDLVPSEPESMNLTVFPHRDFVRIYAIGSDDIGTMYAALDLAEQIELGAFKNAAAMKLVNKKLSPSIPVRGINLFLHTQAFQDRLSWFHSESFWDGFLDTLAKSRFNFLDLHGAYDLLTTQLPNLFPYLLSLPDFAEVGVGPADSAQNLSSLRKIVDKAHAHGINVSLMNYSASSSIPGKPGPKTDNGALQRYTYQCVLRLLESCPGLDGIGFRLGESGQDIEFYRNTYLRALQESGKRPLLFTRSWLADPQEIHDLADAYKGKTVVEVKFNGDHLALPYPVSGGRMSEWSSYSYQNYFDTPRPFNVVFQLKFNGTHRIFPWGDVESIRRTLKNATAWGGNGFSLETYSSYYPLLDAYTNTTFEDLRYYNWTYERDWYWFLFWGRLAYNLQEPNTFFLSHFRRHFGPDEGPLMFEALQSSGDVIPAIASIGCLGPDKRNFAPEFEPPLPLSRLLNLQPLDAFIVRSISEEITAQLTGGTDGRSSPFLWMKAATQDAEKAVASAKKAGQSFSKAIAEKSNDPKIVRAYKEYKSWLLDFQALAALGRHYREKIAGAIHLGVFEETGDVPSLVLASENVKAASQAWEEVCAVTQIHYRPLLEPIRMGDPQYHWSHYPPNAQEDYREISQAYQEWANGNWIRTLGHAPLAKTHPSEPLLLTLSFPPNKKPDFLVVNYQNGAGSTGRLPMTESRIPGVYMAEIPKDQMQAGAFEYFFSGGFEGDPNAISMTSKGRSNTVAVLSEITLPQVKRLEHAISPGHREVTVTAQISDTAGIASVTLFWKPLPSEDDWTATKMERNGPDFTSFFPLTAEGALYAVEAIDGYGNGVRHPDWHSGAPYITIPPFKK